MSSTRLTVEELHNQPAAPADTRVALYIDPPTPHFLRDQLFSEDDAHLGGDGILARFRYLRDVLGSTGIEVHTADLLPQSRSGRNLYVSFTNLANCRRLARRADVTLSALFIMECP